jgi:uncharacterized phage protein gp47/JayE
MAFEPKTFVAILADMVAHARASNDRVTDFNVGSVARSWLEAAAIALDDLWVGTAIGIDEAIVEAVFSSFGFDRIPAAYAQGEVTFYRDAPSVSDTLIAAGARVQSLGGSIVYLTLDDALIPAGAYEVTTPVRSEAAGQASNVAAGALTTLLTDPPTGVSVTNRLSIDTGAAEETDAARRERFAAYIQALSRGTVSALDYAARLAILTDADTGEVLEQVRHVALREAPGSVWLYVHNGTGATSDALVARVADIIEGSADYESGNIVPGWRSAGVEVIVEPMQDAPLAVRFQASLSAGYAQESVGAAVEAALQSGIREMSSGYLSVPWLLSTIYSVPGVLSVTMLDPLSGIEAPLGTRHTLASLEIEWV